MVKISSRGLGAAVLAPHMGHDSGDDVWLSVGATWDIELLHSFWARAFPTNANAVAFCDAHNAVAKKWCGAQKLSIVDHVLLCQFAEEGLANSVEFRRLARKYMRPVKQKNAQFLYLLDPILSAKTPLKVLQHIAGSQLKIVPVVSGAGALVAKKLQIMTPFGVDWTQKRIEKLLNQSLSKKAIIPFTATEKEV